MKSFKLITIQIISSKQDIVDLELAEGLIINKEDDANTWILEALLTEENFGRSEKMLPEIGGEVRVQAVITKKDNDPAVFNTVLRGIKNIDGFVSILLEGHLQRSRSKYAELLLEDLVNKGLDGNDLITQFKEKIHSRPRLVSNKKD